MFIWFLFSFYFLLCSAQNTIKNAIIRVSVGDFNVLVQGSDNSPRYTFWLGSNDTIVYSVFMKQFFEVYGYFENKNMNSVISPTRWDFSQLGETKEGYFFTLTHEASESERSRYKSIEIRNWMAKKNSTNTTCPNEICVQFDITLTGYHWLTHDDDVSLAFSYWITSSASNLPSIDTYDDYVQYGNAIFRIWKNASVTLPGIDTVSYIRANLVDPPINGENWIKFEHFNGILNHHGSIGFDGVGSYLIVDGYFIFTFNEIIMWIGVILAFVIILCIGIWAYNKYQNRKAEYIEID